VACEEDAVFLKGCLVLGVEPVRNNPGGKVSVAGVHVESAFQLRS